MIRKNKKNEFTQNRSKTRRVAKKTAGRSQNTLRQGSMMDPVDMDQLAY